MTHLRQRLFYCISLFLVGWTVVCSCHSNQSTDTANLDFNILSKNDSLMISNSIRNSSRVDTLTSETGCSTVLRFFDALNHLRILKSRQLCISDTRLKWGFEIYYDENEKEILKISRDGLNKIIELKRTY